MAQLPGDRSWGSLILIELSTFKGLNSSYLPFQLINPLDTTHLDEASLDVGFTVQSVLRHYIAPSRRKGVLFALSKL